MLHTSISRHAALAQVRRDCTLARTSRDGSVVVSFHELLPWLQRLLSPELGVPMSCFHGCVPSSDMARWFFIHFALVSCDPVVTSAEVAKLGHGHGSLVFSYFVVAASYPRVMSADVGRDGPQTKHSGLHALCSGILRSYAHFPRGGLSWPRTWHSGFMQFVLVSCDPLMSAEVA